MTPKSLSDRIEVIDVLRGFALLGIVLVHMVEQYYAGPIPEAISKSYQSSIADGITEGFTGIFIMGKFYMIFSFLFGLSFFIQLSKNDGEKNFLMRFAWRLLILFAIGMLHHLHYRGDILTIYAILGFGLFLFYRLPDKALLIVSILLIFNVPSLIVRAVGLFLPGPGNPFDFTQESLMAYYQTVKSGTYAEILLANYNSFYQKMDFQVNSGRAYITLGLFLLGIYAGRKNLFTNVSLYKPFLKKVLKYAGWSLLALIVLNVAIFGTLTALKIEVTEKVGWLVGGISFDIFNAALAAIYLAGILLLFEKEKWRNRLMIFYPVGRMGLTTYLMQTVFGIFIFFSIGLGLVYEPGPFYSLLIGVAVFAFQIYFSKWWFTKFSMGPVEWLWRSLTYFKVQSMKKRTELAVMREAA